MGQLEIILMLGVAFIFITWGHIVTALKIPTEYEVYVAVGGGILIFAAIYNLYERKR